MLETIRHVEEYLDTHEEEVHFLLSSLVNMDSGSDDAQGIARVLQTLSVNLKDIAFDVEIKKETETFHLVARKKGRGQKKILLLGHADTVFERGTALSRQYKMKKDIIEGPGVADMKGGLVTIVYALKALTHIKEAPYKELVIVISGDEELGSPTSKSLIEAEAKGSDACFVLEAGRADRSLVTARKGVGAYQFYVEGVAAHAGEAPEKGASAVTELAKLILALENLTDLEEGITVNVGLVKGGTRANIIPDAAEGEIDVRFPTTAKGDQVMREICQILTHPQDDRVSIFYEGGQNRPPMEKTEETLKLLDIVRSAGDEIGLSIVDTSAGGASDGNLVSAMGIPVIDGMGPDGGNYHREDEFIFRESLLQKTKLMAITLLKMNH